MTSISTKRVYQDEAIEIFFAEMSLDNAKARLDEIAQFPGQVVSASAMRNAEGELWFEIYNDNGDLVADPVMFTKEAALDTLQKTGVPFFEAFYLLSEEHIKKQMRQV